MRTGSFRGLLLEAAFSPIRGKRKAAGEFYRVLSPGGRVMLNDFALKRQGAGIGWAASGIPCFRGVGTMEGVRRPCSRKPASVRWRPERSTANWSRWPRGSRDPCMSASPRWAIIWRGCARGTETEDGMMPGAGNGQAGRLLRHILPNDF